MADWFSSLAGMAVGVTGNHPIRRHVLCWLLIHMRPNTLISNVIYTECYHVEMQKKRDIAISGACVSSLCIELSHHNACVTSTSFSVFPNISIPWLIISKYISEQGTCYQSSSVEHGALDIYFVTFANSGIHSKKKSGVWTKIWKTS